MSWTVRFIALGDKAFTQIGSDEVFASRGKAAKRVATFNKNFIVRDNINRIYTVRVSKGG